LSGEVGAAAGVVRGAKLGSAEFVLVDFSAHFPHSVFQQ
jgi:hypothetical protein